MACDVLCDTSGRELAGGDETATRWRSMEGIDRGGGDTSKQFDRRTSGQPWSGSMFISVSMVGRDSDSLSSAIASSKQFWSRDDCMNNGVGVHAVAS